MFLDTLYEIHSTLAGACPLLMYLVEGLLIE
jgi:hypothetical protein